VTGKKIARQGEIFDVIGQKSAKAIVVKCPGHAFAQLRRCRHGEGLNLWEQGGAGHTRHSVEPGRVS
jgi:hypothetical protein